MKRTMKTTFFITMLALWLPAQAAPLNDTGIAWSGQYPTGDAATCIAPAGQDCFQGRDKARADGTLAKTGHSAYDVNPVIGAYPNGFDYTKIAHDGTALPPAAALGTGADDWACTRDNVTGLIWEIKTAGGLRGQAHSYTWYDHFSPDGGLGTEDGGTCDTPGRCDTEKYVADVNAAGLCGAADWRMPTARELEGIADMGRAAPAIDPLFFINTPLTDFWSASPSAAGHQFAWLVNFSTGMAIGGGLRSAAYPVRLVRKAP